jgi:hypothetical protein
MKSWFRIRIRIKAFEGQKRSAKDRNRSQWGARKLKIEPWKSRIRFRIEVKSWIRVRIKVMRTRNPEKSMVFLTYACSVLRSH